MAAQTLTPQDNDQDTLHNPGAQNAENLFEKHGVLSQDEVDQRRNQHTGNSQQNVMGRESSPSDKQALGDTATGKAATGAASVAATPLAGAAIKLLGKLKTKKGGIGAGIAGVFIALILLIIGFTAPGLLIVQVKEAMTEKFDDVATAISDRNVLIVRKKISDATSGCGTIKVKCRFKGMSDRQINRIEKTGVKVETSGTKNAFGRTTVTKLVTPEGAEITARNYRQVLRTNPVALGHMNRAFNPKFISYSSKAFESLSRRVGITKQKNITGVTDEELDKKFRETATGETARNATSITPETDKDGNTIYRDADGNVVSQADADKISAANADIDKAIKEASSTGKKAALGIAKSTALTTLTGGVGIIDGVCTGYYLIQAVGFGAKLIGAQQLIRYGFIFMNTADSIKAGDATPQEVEYIAKKLTKVDMYGESATDSFGYKWAALGSLKQPSGEEARASTFQYSLGGGLAGALTNFTSILNGATNNSPKTACKVVKNPWTQAGFLIGGVALTIATFGSSSISGAAASVAQAAILATVVAVAVPIITNLAAGTMVTPETEGGDAGNAMVAGMGALNAQNGQSHALSPLTKDQAIGYAKHSDEIATRNKTAAQAVSNPYDIYDPNSPAFTMASSISQATRAQTIASVPTNILKQGITSLFAKSVSAATDPAAEFNLCKDEDYDSKNYAADPFCNIRYGLTPDELELDPEDVVNWMYDNDHIDAEGRPASDEFKTYISDCVSRILPIGSTGSDGQGNDGSDCSNQDARFKYFRVYYLDTILNDDLDDEDTFDLGIASVSSAGPSVIGTPEDVISSGKGYTLADGKDYSGIACAEGTETLNVYTHPTTKFTIQLCGVGGLKVASIISASTKQLLDAARADSTPLGGGGFRSYEEQLALRSTNGCPDPLNSSPRACRIETAVPGTSLHERGIAIDFTYNGDVICYPEPSSRCTGNRGFTWLKNNANRFNLYNLPSEAWHWSTSGS